MASIKNTLMLSCKKATELIEKKDLVGLDPMQNMQLSLHLMMCKACKDYEKQSTFLDEMIARHLKQTQDKPDHLQEEVMELKKQINKQLREKTD